MMQNHSRRMGRLVAAGLLPERAGQPAKVWAHISLADLLALDPGSALAQEWAGRVHGQWAAARAAASVAGGDGAAWLEGDAAQGFACDASVTPIVTGEVNPGAMEDLVRLCVQLAGYGPGRGADGADPQPPTERGREALEKAIIGKTTILLLRSRSALDLRLFYRSGRYEYQATSAAPSWAGLACR
jgi:hypothetical protein